MRKEVTVTFTITPAARVTEENHSQSQGKMCKGLLKEGYPKYEKAGVPNIQPFRSVIV
jgi:hypothetical protein